jgi:hypothetical protein
LDGVSKQQRSQKEKEREQAATSHYPHAQLQAEIWRLQELIDAMQQARRAQDKAAGGEMRRLATGIQRETERRDEVEKGLRHLVKFVEDLTRVRETGEDGQDSVGSETDESVNLEELCEGMISGGDDDKNGGEVRGLRRMEKRELSSCQETTLHHDEKGFGSRDGVLDQCRRIAKAFVNIQVCTPFHARFFSIVLVAINEQKVHVVHQARPFFDIYLFSLHVPSYRSLSPCTHPKSRTQNAHPRARNWAGRL